MGIRMTGIISGLDTDAIVKELMNAHTLKKTKIENKITKHEWKQDKWKELNTKIYSLYTGSLSKLKTQGSYLAKKAASSNESKISVKASNDAVEGSHTIKVNQLASSQYLTSGKLTATDEENNAVAVTTSTKLVNLGMEEGTTINIASGSKSYSYDVSDSSTVNDFLNACKQVGLNATFDNLQGRLFISSSASGADNAFSITSAKSEAANVRNEIREAVGYSAMNSAFRKEIDKALFTYTDPDASEEEKEKASTLLYERTKSYTTIKYKNDILADFKSADSSGTSAFLDAYTVLEAKAAAAKQEYLNGLPNGESDANFSQTNLDKAVNTALTNAAAEYVNGILSDFNNADADKVWSDGENPYGDAVNNMDQLLNKYEVSDDTEVPSEDQLKKLGISDITYEKNADGSLTYTSNMAEGAALVGASNSKIIYNGAVLDSSSNTVTANGLTFTVQDLTVADETITLTVSKDTDAVYNTIKTFLTEYNALLEEMNKSYNANSAKGYEPLTDEERESMTEDQIDKWETKIKDSLLRRDTTLGSLISTFKDSLMGTVQYNGKSYSLSSFGISTKYYTEKGKLHIAGDSEDPLTSEDKDKLMAALQDDPEAVMNVLSNLGQKLYDNVNSKMKSSSLSSAMNVYNDKQMKKELTNYEEQLKKMEVKLKDLENRYYKQFTAMEKAMSNLTSQSNSLAAMMGTNTQQQ